MLAQRTVQNGASAELLAIDSALAVIVFSRDGTVLRANARFLALSGYNARALIGQPRSVLVARRAADTEADAAFWAAVQLGDGSQDTERPLLRKDGSVIWIRASATPIADAEGQIAEVVMFASDITEARRKTVDDRGQIVAINASQAVIHFAPDGTILDANARFLRAMGFELAEIVGQPHRIFVDATEAASADYAALWRALAQGQPQSGVYCRLGKGGREVWLQCSYSPISDMNGRISKVVNYATDITADKLQQAAYQGKIKAIDKSHGVITFDMNGTVLDANENFLRAFGYRIEEVEGRHHRMFVDPSFAHGPEYASFWNSLSDGRHQSGDYKRIGKDGREIWLQASYNPIHDLNGKPFRVVQYAIAVTREKLRQADHQGQIASIHKTQSVISFELDGTVIDANDNFLDVTGYRLAEVRGRHHRMFVDDATAQSQEYLSFWSELAKGRHKAGEFKRLGKGGREVWLQATYNPIFDMNGRPFKVVKYATDITSERMRQIDFQGQIAAIHRSQCVAAFDMEGKILDVNDNFLAAVGYARHEILGKHHKIFVDPAFADSAEYQGFWDTLRTGKFLSEKFSRLGKGGRQIWLQASYNPILDLNGCPFKIIKIATDVTAEVALAADFIHARRQAHHDASTGLPNRAGFSQFLATALADPKQRLAILYLDLDHFKPINDTFGHHVGDHVLYKTAHRLMQTIASDQMVARIGGDEFAVAAPNLSDEQIDRLCHRLIDAVQAPLRHDKCTLTVGLSIGVAVSPHDATNPDDLLRCADVALYRTKGNGRGSYSFFAADMEERLSAKRNLAEEMRHGIKAGQFFLEYRPRIDAQTLQVESVHAGVYWEHPSNGRLEPAEFIALADQSGLIVPLGEWMLRTACHAAAGWNGVGVTLHVSPIQFAGTEFSRVVEAVLAESGLAPERLELEISERILTDDADRAHAALEALKAHGVRLTLDDLGSHHASLESVRRFPLDTVNIDQRFIGDIEGERGGRGIARDIRRVGDALAAAAPPPGVEIEGQLLTLRLDDSAELSGFLLGKALPEQTLASLLKRAESVVAHAYG